MGSTIVRAYYLAVISGRKRGVGAALFKALLALLSVAYWVLHRTRRLFYSLGILRTVKLPVPVVSVGNLTAGGSGKTPLVELVARWFAAHRFRVAILARGYGKTERGDDEGLTADLENIVRLTGADRVASARRAIEEFRADVILLDDGYQHFRIHRDLDILVVDSTNPFAGGRLLPRGLLRERPSAAARADLVVLTRTDQAPRAVVDALRDQLYILSGGKPVIETVHRPVSVRSLWNKKRHDVDWLRGRAVYGFCGLGNPEAFKRTLESAGANVVKFRAFPDHHRYGGADLRLLNVEAQEFMAEIFVTTEKDASKLHPEGFEKPLAVLRVELEVARGEEALEGALLELFKSRRPAAAEVPTR
jgi:tetraacyldisaccharide 4'-kinase